MREILDKIYHKWDTIQVGDKVMWIDHKSERARKGSVHSKIPYGLTGYFVIEEYVTVDYHLTMVMCGTRIMKDE